MALLPLTPRWPPSPPPGSVRAGPLGRDRPT